MTRREHVGVGALLKREYGPLVNVQVQQPCKALLIKLEGPDFRWTAVVPSIDSPILLMLLPGLPPQRRPAR